MSSEQLVIESQKNEIRRLKEDLENMNFSLSSKEKQLQIQKRKGSQFQNHNNILTKKITSLEEKIKEYEHIPQRQIGNFSSPREATDILRQSTNETNQLKKQLELKEEKIKQLKKDLKKSSDELKEKDKMIAEKENLSKMYQELEKKYQKIKEDLQNQVRIDRQESVLVSNISSDKESVLSDSFSLPEKLNELSAIKVKNSHFVDIPEMNFPENAMVKKKQKVDLIENIQKDSEQIEESMFIVQRQRDDPVSDQQQFEDMSRVPPLHENRVPPLYENRVPTLYEKIFSSIMSQLSMLPPQKQWSFLNMVSFWTESKMQKLSDSLDDN